MARVRRKLGEILQGWGLVNDEQIAQALKVAQGSRKRIGEVLIELDFVSESDVAKALANQFNMEYIDLEQPDAISRENLKELPEDIIKKYLVLPLEKENGKIKVLIHDPMDLDLLDYEGQVLDLGGGEIELHLPHPRLHERAFVLVPLAEIAPDWRHPISGQGIEALLREIGPDQALQPL